MVEERIIETVDVARFFPGPRKAFGFGRHEPIRAVDGVSLHVSDGESVGLVGESGSGKSTLARMMLLLDKPTGGEIRYRGANEATLSKGRLADFRRDVQPVFQDPYQSLDPRMRVGSIVTEPLRAQGGYSNAELARRAAEALERVELRATDAARRPVDFSGGQRQRIALARALVSGPRMIVLDEAVSSQDVSIRAQILNLLKDIQSDEDVAYLFISHDLTTVRFLCDRVYVMYMGTIVECGTPEAVFRNPAHPYTAMLLDACLPADPDLAGSREPMPEAPYWPGHPDKGCPFAPRCDRAGDECRRSRPEPAQIGPGHTAACYNPMARPGGPGE